MGGSSTGGIEMLHPGLISNQRANASFSSWEIYNVGNIRMEYGASRSSVVRIVPDLAKWRLYKMQPDPPPSIAVL